VQCAVERGDLPALPDPDPGVDDAVADPQQGPDPPRLLHHRIHRASHHHGDEHYPVLSDHRGRFL